MQEQTPKCDCGAEMVWAAGKWWCPVTLAKYRALYGEPRC